MDNYYRFHAAIYDLTRPLFLFERDRVTRDLELQPGNVVIEMGCGTGYNLRSLVKKVGSSGRVYGVDCSESMLRIAREKVKKQGWKNVSLAKSLVEEYSPPENAHVVLFSYSLSMIVEWEKALDRAISAIEKDGKLVILDFSPFCSSGALYPLWEKWLKWNHVFLRKEPVEYIKKRAVHCELALFHRGYNYRIKARF